MYRDLTLKEINILKVNNCVAEDWDKIKVKKNFNPDSYLFVSFSGNIKLGETNYSIELWGGVRVQSGIYKVILHNCVIGDNVYISNVNQYIANYTIGNNVVINNVDKIYSSGDSCFGNGQKISVLNETGGRDVMIYDKMSSHLAYIMSMYRHEDEMIRNVEQMILEYSDNAKSEGGYIGDYTEIIGCRTIIDVRIGEGAKIYGTSLLRNGSINSTKDARVTIGDNVIAKDFIICSSSSIKDGAIIEKCFIGQGCDMGKQYSAENSLFFSNCVGMHGEACSIFAGPHTVTHHKSTLLIAGMFSFMNAGSGSNQSNHMYKLGPIHQGIIDRGSKTTSDSYILWPAKVGAFSVVMGRHYNNSDTSIFPFSYIIENNNKTYLAPAVNLKSVGTIRDAKKWPKRDSRKGEKIDQINYNLLSPYTIIKMMKGTERLQQLLSISGLTSETYSYKGCVLNNSAVKKGVNYYEMAITKFIGNSIIKRIENVSEDVFELRKRLKPSTEIGIGEWVDLSGLITPKSNVINLISEIKNGVITSLDAIHDEFIVMCKNYYEYEWTWVYNKLINFVTKDIEDIKVEELIEYVEKWLVCVISLDRLLYEDAKKEFTLTSMTGFGLDGDKKVKESDFKNVRGEFENNDFVLEVLEHIEKKTNLGKYTINKLKELSLDKQSD